MRDFKRNLLAEFLEQDERIRSLYQQIEGHPKHKRKITVVECMDNKKGKIKYLRHEVIIEMDITLEDESILILAHELMHYLLVLDGALLPIEIREKLSSEAESLKFILMRSITHHFLLRQRLDTAGFKDLQLCYSLSDKPLEMPYGYYYDEKIWPLVLYDNSTFAKNYNYDSLREKFESYKMISVFELLQSARKESIQDINKIANLLIKMFNVEDSLRLVALDEYTSQ